MDVGSKADTAARVLKSIARHTGLTSTVKPWVQALVDGSDYFYSLSPDLLVALVRAFRCQTNFDNRAFYEFGLYRGFSIWFAEQIARGHTPADFRFYGFDSFCGLPDTVVDADFYRRGDFSAGYETVKENLTRFGADWEKIKLFRGFFSDGFFAELVKKERFQPVSIAVIDVDIYESCVPVLNFLSPLLVPGSILIFDDYNGMHRSDSNGERKAFKEFKAKTGLEAELLFELGRECAAFEVVKAPTTS